MDELLALSAFLLADGCLTSTEKGNYMMVFYNRSKALLSTFADAATRLGSKPHVLQDRVVIYDNKLARSLLELTPSYRTKPCDSRPKCPRSRGLSHGPCARCTPLVIGNTRWPPTRIPEPVFTDPGITRSYLRILFSCDGGVELRHRRASGRLILERRISITSAHPLVRAQIVKLLSSLGISARVEGPHVLIYRKRSLRIFADEIGFLPGALVVRGKHWRGYEKARVLELLTMGL